MLSFRHKEDRLEIVIDTGLSVDKPSILANWSCGTSIEAAALEKHMNDKFEDRVKAARAESYEKGWKDAKAKRQRETWFGGWI